MSFLSRDFIIDTLGKNDENYENIENEESEEALEDLYSYEEHYGDLNQVDISQENAREKLKRLCDTLPCSREVDMLDMSYLYNKDQTSIGKMYNVSQGDVSYRLKRIKKRFKYLLSLPELNHQLMYVELKTAIGEPLSKIMMLLLKHTSQSKVGSILNISQGKVRHRYIRALEILKEKCKEDPKLIIYFDYLSRLKGNYNTLRTLNIQDRWKHKFHSSELENDSENDF